MNRRELIAAGVSLMATAPLARAAAGGTLITRRIPSSGEELPIIGLGTSRTFEVGIRDAERAPLKAVLESFFAAGARLIDTSPMYTTAEGVLGELLTPAMHARAFLATKVWTRGKAEGVAQMRHSEDLLRARPLDLIQVHNLLDLETQLATLREWKAAGKVRYLGVTHYTVAGQAELERVLSRERLDFVQLNYSPVTRNAEARLLPLAAERGVAVLVNRPFEDGALFARVRDKPLPDFAAEIDAASWGQLILKFIAAHPAVSCIIPATASARHLADDLGGGIGRLPDAPLRERIAAALA
ncbi:MAG TPA: aldo/keto reductase [Steroidobacteraceae bacterium]|nr:aldo/keto reductase [Steroidobacteraceae bacterium]